MIFSSKFSRFKSRYANFHRAPTKVLRLRRSKWKAIQSKIENKFFFERFRTKRIKWKAYPALRRNFILSQYLNRHWMLKRTKRVRFIVKTFFKKPTFNEKLNHIAHRKIKRIFGYKKYRLFRKSRRRNRVKTLALWLKLSNFRFFNLKSVQWKFKSMFFMTRRKEKSPIEYTKSQVSKHKGVVKILSKKIKLSKFNDLGATRLEVLELLFKQGVISAELYLFSLKVLSSFNERKRKILVKFAWHRSIRFLRKKRVFGFKGIDFFFFLYNKTLYKDLFGFKLLRKPLAIKTKKKLALKKQSIFGFIKLKDKALLSTERSLFCVKKWLVKNKKLSRINFRKKKKLKAAKKKEFLKKKNEKRLNIKIKYFKRKRLLKLKKIKYSKRQLKTRKRSLKKRKKIILKRTFKKILKRNVKKWVPTKHFMFKNKKFIKVKLLRYKKLRYFRLFRWKKILRYRRRKRKLFKTKRRVKTYKKYGLWVIKKRHVRQLPSYNKMTIFRKYSRAIRLRFSYKLYRNKRLYLSGVFGNNYSFLPNKKLLYKNNSRLAFYLVTLVKPLYKIDVLLFFLKFFSGTEEAHFMINYKHVFVNDCSVTSNIYLVAGDVVSLKISHSYFKYLFTIKRKQKLYPSTMLVSSFFEYDYYTNTILILKNYSDLSYVDLSILFKERIKINSLFTCKNR